MDLLPGGDGARGACRLLDGGEGRARTRRRKRSSSDGGSGWEKAPAMEEEHDRRVTPWIIGHGSTKGVRQGGEHGRLGCGNSRPWWDGREEVWMGFSEASWKRKKGQPEFIEIGGREYVGVRVSGEMENMRERWREMGKRSGRRGEGGGDVVKMVRERI